MGLDDDWQFGTDEERAASRELVDATRDLMVASGVAALDPDRMRAAATAIQEVTASLRPGRSRLLAEPRVDVRQAWQAGQSWRTHAHNPLGIPMELRLEGDRLVADLPANPLFEGPRDRMHGGFSAAILDIALGILVMATQVPAMTAGLEVTFRRSLPVGVPLRLEAWVAEVSGRKITAEGWIGHDQVPAVLGKGLFIAPATAAEAPDRPLVAR